MREELVLGFSNKQYADDTQAYRHCKATEAMHALTELVNTIAEIKDWMSSNRLKLNPSKTQYIWIGGTGASTLAIRRPILSCGQSLLIIIDADAGIRCGWTVGVERFACGCACLHSQKQKQLQNIDQDTFVQFGNKVTIWNSFRTVH